MKKILSLTPRQLKIYLIIAPMLISVVYYLFVAADRFVSESIITVRRADQEQTSAPGIAMLLAGMNSPSYEDAIYLRGYIHSLDLLNRLNERMNLRAHYESERLDPIFRLYGGTSQEWFLEYYRSRVEVLFDEQGALLHLRVQGFDPDFAQRLNQQILEECEAFVNGYTHRMAREKMDFAESEMQRSAERLQEMKGKLLDFQTRNKLLDPAAQAQAAGSLTAELHGQLARKEAELKNLLTFLNEDAYQVQSLRSQLAALRSQIDVERKRATANNSDERLNALSAEYQNLTLQVGFAQDAYKLALTAAENARIDATRKLKSLVVIEPPSKPETALYPRRIYDLLTILVVLTLVYGIVRLVLATVREHMD